MTPLICPEDGRFCTCADGPADADGCPREIRLLTTRMTDARTGRSFLATWAGTPDPRDPHRLRAPRLLSVVPARRRSGS